MKLPIITIMCTYLLLTTGCATKPTLGPKPASPQDWVNVLIDSTPEDAEVYSVDKKGVLGEKLGTTPLEIPLGFARNSYSDGSPCTSPDCITVFDVNGVSISSILDSGDVLLHFALLNDKIKTIVRNKHLGNTSSYPPPDIALVIPVEKIPATKAQALDYTIIHNSLSTYGPFYTKECAKARRGYKRAVSAYNEARDDIDMRRQMQDTRLEMKSSCSY